MTPLLGQSWRRNRNPRMIRGYVLHTAVPTQVALQEHRQRLSLPLSRREKVEVRSRGLGCVCWMWSRRRPLGSLGMTFVCVGLGVTPTWGTSVFRTKLSPSAIYGAVFVS